MNDVTLESFDSWLQDSGPAALVLREHLTSVEGEDGVIFPPTFAATEDKTFKGGYNVDEYDGGSNVCLIDSVGSQANRIEPMFSRDGYNGLVPQIVVVAGKKKVNLLVEAGHRAGDAIVRCSSLQEDLHDAFMADLGGDATKLAKIAPTSLVFGVWDSRDTQAKRPRLVSSTIRAYNVMKLHRSAQFNPATSYVEDGLLDKAADTKGADAQAERGFVHVPASWSHGGVVAKGGIRRDATLHLAALRLLGAKDEDGTRTLRRYVLGLALTAFTFSPPGYLRQGCNLVLDPAKKREGKTVYGDGRREDAGLPNGGAALTHTLSLEFAKLAAKAFGVGENREVPFDIERAKKDLAGDEEAKKAKEAKKRVAKG